MSSLIEKMVSDNPLIPYRISDGAKNLSGMFIKRFPAYDNKKYKGRIEAASLYIYAIATSPCPHHGSGIGRQRLGKMKLLQWDLAQKLDCSATNIYHFTQKIIGSLTPSDFCTLFGHDELQNLAYNGLVQPYKTKMEIDIVNTQPRNSNRSRF